MIVFQSAMNVTAFEELVTKTKCCTYNTRWCRWCCRYDFPFLLTLQMTQRSR